MKLSRQIKLLLLFGSVAGVILCAMKLKNYALTMTTAIMVALLGIVSVGARRLSAQAFDATTK